MRNVAAELNGSRGCSFLGWVDGVPAAGPKGANVRAIRDVIRKCPDWLTGTRLKEAAGQPGAFSLAEMPRMVEDSDMRHEPCGGTGTSRGTMRCAF